MAGSITSETPCLCGCGGHSQGTSFEEPGPQRSQQPVQRGLRILRIPTGASHRKEGGGGATSLPSTLPIPSLPPPLPSPSCPPPAPPSPVPSLPSRCSPPIPPACPPGALPLQDACRKNRKVFLDEKPKDTWGQGFLFTLLPAPHPLRGAERLAGGAGSPEAQVSPLRGLLRWAGGGLPS